MNVHEIYKTYQIKVNKNDTNKNIKVNEAIFVKIYNEQSKVWLEDQIRENESNYQKNEISDLLEIDYQLGSGITSDNFVKFPLPSNFFDIASSYSVASKGECKDRILLNWDFKIKNKNSLIQDENFKPSFEYEETLINLSKGNLIVFRTDFNIDKQYISYWTTPKEIDIKGYIKEDGTSSTDINPDLPDPVINKIINLSVLETIRIFENPDGFNLAKDRITK